MAARSEVTKRYRLDHHVWPLGNQAKIESHRTSGNDIMFPYLRLTRESCGSIDCWTSIRHTCTSSDDGTQRLDHRRGPKCGQAASWSHARPDCTLTAPCRWPASWCCCSRCAKELAQTCAPHSRSLSFVFCNVPDMRSAVLLAAAAAGPWPPQRLCTAQRLSMRACVWPMAATRLWALASVAVPSFSGISVDSPATDCNNRMPSSSSSEDTAAEGFGDGSASAGAAARPSEAAVHSSRRSTTCDSSTEAMATRSTTN
mmetsp:Transcript_95110/g.306393  ORF Transcript_95110/g.306393 Transcript_95110/m.306393 type:complete len:257 (+) Transcript_95110:56-826(+)